MERSSIQSKDMADRVFMGLETIGVSPTQRGKVREMLDLGDTLLLVATDRISAFDIVMPNGIPGRGAVLNRISAFWLRGLGSIVPTHFVTDKAADFPAELRKHAAILGGRAMVVRKAERIAAECIVRGYLAGSGYTAYRDSGAVNDVKLPPGLKNFDQLPEPIFTPTTKADTGHDEPLTHAELASQVGEELAATLQRLSIEIYRRGAAYAEKHGIVIADTKFEFGVIDGQVALIDEVLTPDSSRFWPRESVGPGRRPVSLDKQFLRDHLLSVKWDRTPPAPELPPEIIEKTRERYVLAERLLTGGSDCPAW
jgi:phosphoribosylaminoimidazole-succinocarboxamide synthase